ncbi:hypothetical protein Tco_0051812 [Tanacetum coccineum]
MDESLEVPEQTILETFSHISPENKAHYDAGKEAIYLFSTGIGDEIYSIVDACKTAHDIWIAIERLQQGESLNKQDVKTSLFWEFGKFTSRDGESIESYYFRFYKMMNEMVRNQLEVAHILYPDTYYQAPTPHRSYVPLVKTSPSIRSHATIRYKGKTNKIAKSITPPSKSGSEEDSEPEQAWRDKEMQKNLALITKYFKKINKPTNNNLRTSSNSRNKNVNTTPRYLNENQTSQFRNPRTVTVVGARETEKMLLYKQAEKCVPLQAREADWIGWSLPTDSGSDAEPLKKVDSNVIPNSSDMCDNDNQADQNAE